LIHSWIGTADNMVNTQQFTRATSIPAVDSHSTIGFTTPFWLMNMEIDRSNLVGHP